MQESLDLESKVETRAPKHGAMSEVDRHSLNMQGRLMERAGGRGCPVGMCRRLSWSSVHTQELEGEVVTVGGPFEPV